MSNDQADPLAGRPTTGLDDWYDDLTTLPGAAFWEVVIAAESARSARFRRPATIVLVEAVGFGEVRRQWGRTVALRDIVDIGRVLRSGCRASDYVVRLDEARFGMLLTETDEIAAINVVERVRARCDAELGSRSAGARVAFGWASPVGKERLPEAIARAEARLRHEAETIPAPMSAGGSGS